MAFSHGSSGRFFAGGQDLSQATKTVTVSGMADVADRTGLSYTNKLYINGLADAKISGQGFYRGTAGSELAAVSSDEHYSAFFGGSVVSFTHYPAGCAIGSYGVSVTGPETDVEFSTPVDDVAAFTVGGQSTYGLDRVVSHYNHGTADATTFTASGTATVVDNGASSTNGAAGVLHFFRLSAGTAVVKIQHSSDNSTFADLVTFSNVVAATSERVCERVAVTGTVNRYTRCVYTITGGTAVFHAALARK